MHILFYAVPGILILSYCAPRPFRALVGVGLGILVSGLVLLPMTLARESRFAVGPFVVGLTALACALVLAAVGAATNLSGEQVAEAVATGWVLSLAVAIMTC